MSFITAILERLEDVPERTAIAAGALGSEERRLVTACALRLQVERARRVLRQLGLRIGDRVALSAPNGPEWVACDLAVLAEGGVLVPFDPRQTQADVAELVRDAGARVFVSPSGSEELPGVPLELVRVSYADLFEGPTPARQPARLVPSDALATLIYTSGSSGRPKGAALTRENLAFMLAQTEARLAELTSLPFGAERALHYLPLCYAGSRVLLLSCLLRGARVELLADPRQLGDHLPASLPDYFLNVPLVLDRFRRAAEEAVAAKGAPLARLLREAVAASTRLEAGQGRLRDRLLLAAARRTVLTPIRARFGGRLRGLICGSAPLSPETQSFFHAVGVPVYQGYGLTETSALCTLDRPGQIRPGAVGPALPGVEMRLNAAGEIETRGPHVFSGYWGRPEATQAAFTSDGWFRTGDAGACDAQGRWEIGGRLSALLVLSTGHNLPPEPLEAELAERLSAALGPGYDELLVCVVGHGKPHAAALVAYPGELPAGVLGGVLEELNAGLPPKARLHAHLHLREAWSPDEGQLTTNLKLRRREISGRYAAQIEGLYQRTPVGASA